MCVLGSPLAQGLPPQVEADRQLQLAAAEMEKAGAADWPKAVEALEAAAATGVRMPANFDYHLGRALLGADRPGPAQERLERYLREQGAQGKYYSEALQQYSLAKTRAEAARVAAAKQAALNAAWVKVKTVWRQDDSEDESCRPAKRRLTAYAPSARNIHCHCQVSDIDHPAWRDYTQSRCELSWEGNLIEEKRSSFNGDMSYPLRRGSRTFSETLRSVQQ